MAEEIKTDEIKTEVEFAGVKFRGGKIFVLITALSTLGGGLYAGFEFWKDYMDMKEKIEKYTAPDLSGFDKRIAIIRKEMDSLEKEVGTVSQVNKDLKVDMQGDIRRTEGISEQVERRVKEDSREFSKEIRDLVKNTDERLKKIEKDTDTRLRKVEDDVDLKINKALKNPLNALSGK